MKNCVKVYRAMHNLTQAQLAEKLEVSHATINVIEKEAVKNYCPASKSSGQIRGIYDSKSGSSSLNKRSNHEFRC